MTFCHFADQCTVYDSTRKLSGMTGRLSNICEGCRGRAEREIGLLKFDYVDLSQLIPTAGMRTNEAQIYRPKPQSSPPLNMNAYALRSEVAWLLLSMEHAVRQVMADTAAMVPSTAREGYRLDAAVRYLQVRVVDVARLPAMVQCWSSHDEQPSALGGLDLLLRVTRVHHAARTMLGLQPRRIKVPGQCPGCQLWTLTRVEDSERVSCMACNLHLSTADYLRAQREVFTRSDKPDPDA